MPISVTNYDLLLPGRFAPQNEVLRSCGHAVLQSCSPAFPTSRRFGGQNMRSKVPGLIR